MAGAEGVEAGGKVERTNSKNPPSMGTSVLHLRPEQLRKRQA